MFGSGLSLFKENYLCDRTPDRIIENEEFNRQSDYRTDVWSIHRKRC